jgi:hypothetical protein
MSYLFLDKFTADTPAPIGGTLTGDPGPGAWTVYDTSAVQYVQNGRYFIPSGVNSETSGLWTGLFAHAAGRCYGASSYTNDRRISLGEWAGNLNLGGISSNHLNTPSQSALYAGDIQERYAFIRSETGLLYVVGKTYNKLLWVSPSNHKNIANMGMCLHIIGDTSASFDDAFIADLGAPWTTDYGIAVDTKLTASAGDTLNAPADVLLEGTWTAVTGQTWNLYFRRASDTNTLVVRGSQSGSTIKLIKIDGGVETELATAAHTWVNGTHYRVVVRSDTDVIQVWNTSGERVLAAVDLSFNQTQTGAKTDQALTDFIAWPRVLVGTTLDALNAVWPTQKDWYASPTGTGDGSPEHPWGIATALAATKIKPGDVLWLAGGTYTGNVTCTLNGTEANRITVRSCPNERAIINGLLTISGSYTDWYRIENAYLDWTSRTTEDTGSFTGPSNVASKVDGSTIRVIECVWHDLSLPFAGVPATAFEVSDSLFYHMGWSAPDRGHGHGLYLQNGAVDKLIYNSIFHDNFGWGIHCYTENQTIDNFQIIGNTSFNNGSLFFSSDTYYESILVGGGVKANHILLDENHTYHGVVNIGYSAVSGADDVVLSDNHFASGVSIQGTTNLTDTGNIKGTVGNAVYVRPIRYTWDSDNETLVSSVEPKKASVTVYNQSNAPAVSVDLSAVSGLVSGDIVTARNAQDYFVDAAEYTLDSDKKISLSMASSDHTVETPIQWTAPATSFPTFGAFILERTGTTSTGPAPEILPIQLSVAVRNARLNAIETTIGISPVLEIRTGNRPANLSATDTGTVLATLTLPEDWMEAASDGTKAKGGTWQGAQAEASGTAGHYRLYDSEGTPHIQGTVTQTGASPSGDMTLSSTNIVINQGVTIDTFTWTEGNA